MAWVGLRSSLACFSHALTTTWQIRSPYHMGYTMGMSTAASNELSMWLDPQEKYFVEGDGNIFLASAQEIVEGLKLKGNEIAHAQAVRKLFATLGSWIKDQEKAVTDAYLGVGSEGLEFIVVTEGHEYDAVADGIEQSLAELNTAIGADQDLRDFYVNMVRLHANSPELRQVFIPSKRLWRYAVRSRAR